MKYTGNDISVLMSVYKRTKPEELSDAVRSVINEQSVVPYELILVIDGPISDELMQVIMELDVNKMNIIQLSTNKGLSNALNEGLKLAKTVLIARMDSDDIAVPDRFEKQLKAFNANEKLAVYGGGVLEFEKYVSDATAARILPETDHEIRSFLKVRSPFNHPTVMFKTKIIQENNGYLEMGNLEDYFLWLRLSLVSGIEFGNSSDIFVNMRGGEALYTRRGSLNYIKQILTLRTWMFQHKIIGIFGFIEGLLTNSIVAILPVKIRKIIYGLFLRKNIE